MPSPLPDVTEIVGKNARANTGDNDNPALSPLHGGPAVLAGADSAQA
jgi:hypothetical protein